jgi:toxin ParE1/3/4
VNRPIIIRPRAEADLQEAKSWYDFQRSGLGAEFVDAFRQAIRLLEKAPERQPLYYRGFRRLMTRRFPYKIFYRLEGEQIIVFRVLHSKRDHSRHL